MLHSPLARLRSRRVARGLAALTVLMLVASNALAAAGLCLAKTPLPQVVTVATATAAAEHAPCPYHAADEAPLPDHPAVPSAHCPQDEPAAQVRADTPAADLAVIAVAPLPAPLPAARDLQPRASVDESPPTPLYSRLSRRLL
jgi:hypothetical protein